MPSLATMPRLANMSALELKRLRVILRGHGLPGIPVLPPCSCGGTQKTHNLCGFSLVWTIRCCSCGREVKSKDANHACNMWVLAH